MATALQCGFEAGDTNETFATGGTFTVQSSVTRGAWSAWALRTNPTTTGTGFNEISGHLTTTGARSRAAISAATVFYRWYFRPDTLPSANDEEFMNVLATNSTTVQAVLRITSAGKIALYNGSNTLITTGTAVLSTGNWYRIEFKCGNGTGAVAEWKVTATGDPDGTATTDVSTTFNTNALNNAGLRLGKVANRNGRTVDFYFDDVLASDSGYPGPGHSGILVPSANGTYQTWNPSAAVSHFTLVDDVPNDGNTTFLSSPNVSGNAETEALQDSSTLSISGTINTVKPFAILATSSGTGAIRLRTRTGSTDTDTGTNASIATTYALFGIIRDTDPATGLAWTTSGIDGMETGVIERSTTVVSKMTLCGAMVDWTPSTGGAVLSPVPAIVAGMGGF